MSAENVRNSTSKILEILCLTKYKIFSACIISICIFIILYKSISGIVKYIINHGTKHTPGPVACGKICRILMKCKMFNKPAVVR